MGYMPEFNWVLKIKPEQGLDENNLETEKIYNFSKQGSRNYPLLYPILLVNNIWEAIGLVEILNFNADKDSTKGKYKVIKIYKDIDKEILTKFLQDNIRYYKKEYTKDFKDIKAT